MSDFEVDDVPPVMMSNEPAFVDESVCADHGAQSLVPDWEGGRVPIIGVRIGILVGIADNGHTPLVVFAGRLGSAAVRARAIIDLHGSHIGHEVALMFNEGDARQPIVMGCISRDNAWPVKDRRGQVEVDVDGERLVINAKDQLVLRCGKATITLTKRGKVLIQGTYVSSRSSGVNRMKGGSIHLN